MRLGPMVWPIREVNLLPCFLGVVGGVAIWWRELSRQAARFHLLDFDGAAGLAALRVGLIALLIFTMMFVTLDRSDSQLSPGDRAVFLGKKCGSGGFTGKSTASCSGRCAWTCKSRCEPIGG
jgi:hypothetical protein